MPPITSVMDYVLPKPFVSQAARIGVELLRSASFRNHLAITVPSNVANRSPPLGQLSTELDSSLRVVIKTS